ncbi:MAG TPA: hypothetical protein VK550_03245 [Polyangiaceae bacterium]|nr:hypothetical protein [Polyangiaceae bacterium]
MGGLVLVALLLSVTLWERPAQAYAWMIKHDYAGCNQCHADPSGGSVLTEYGRAQSDFLLRMRYGAKDSWEAPPSAGFLFGAFKLPPSVLLGGDVRYATITKSTNGNPTPTRAFFMQADFTGQISTDRFRVAGSIGYADEGALLASLTHQPDGNVVSRAHWVGLDIGEDKNWLLRAGRMNLPFGIRTAEHTMWARTATRSDINVGQQHGVALAYNGTTWRGELMAIAGNFQVSPAEYRERGYSGMLEFAVATNLGMGVSSLVTVAGRNLYDPQVPLTRHAHGGFIRYAPSKLFVLMAELDLLAYAPSGSAQAGGTVGMFQVDFEPTQGLHLIATGETFTEPLRPGSASDIWGSAAWFLGPHFDIRVDAIRQSFPNFATTTVLAQIHAFL